MLQGVKGAYGRKDQIPGNHLLETISAPVAPGWGGELGVIEQKREKLVASEGAKKK